ncbi:MAG TPA: outer membrane beta-barrel protein [Stellaceae bacterium]|nr:outer membrane beta-barrel protein [Stellaceae bacterium]
MEKSALSGTLLAGLMSCVGLGAAWAADPGGSSTFVSPFELAQAPAGQQLAPAAAVPAPTTLTTPAMAGPLTANPNPFSFAAGALGPVYVTGVVSGLGLTQTNRFAVDHDSVISLSNGQVFIQKATGLFQYFVQAGAYTLPAIGSPYFNTAKFTGDFFGPVPQAFLKIAPTDKFSIQAGKLPTLIGAEYTFSFENMNIERGLLWNQENAVNRGVQLNYTTGPLALAFSWNDGFYSNRYTWAWGSIAYTLNKENTFSVVAGGNTAHSAKSTLVTPLFQNNETIVNLIYTYSSAPWTLTPYFQFTHVPTIPSIGAFAPASTYGGALLANYSFPDNSPLRGFSLPVRLEYIASTGYAAAGAPSLLYGPGSDAWSVTITPTYQYKKFFVRAEFSLVGTMHTTAGFAFGPSGTKTTQTRGVLEVGVLF